MGDDSDHTSDYDPWTAIWIAVFGLFALVTVFIAPYFVDNRWYSGYSTARVVPAPAAPARPVPIVQGVPVKTASKPTEPVEPSLITRVALTTGGSVVSASIRVCPDLSSLKVR